MPGRKIKDMSFKNNPEELIDKALAWAGTAMLIIATIFAAVAFGCAAGALIAKTMALYQ